MAIIIDDPGYSRLEQKLIEMSYERVRKQPIENKSRHVSFAVHRNRIVAVGSNTVLKTAPLAQRFNYWGAKIHAELDCLVKATRVNQKIDITKCVFYNVRIDRHNKVRMSKPCKKCQTLLFAFGVTNCLFTNDEGIFELCTL